MSVAVHPALGPSSPTLESTYLLRRHRVTSIGPISFQSSQGSWTQHGKGALPTACQRSAPPACAAFLVPNMQEADVPHGIEVRALACHPGSAVTPTPTVVKQVAIIYKNTTDTGF